MKIFGGRFFFLLYLIYFWLCWIFIAVRGLSLVVASGGYSSLRRTDSRYAGSVVVVHGLSRCAACGIFLDRGSDLCPLHWQVDS